MADLITVCPGTVSSQLSGSVYVPTCSVPWVGDAVRLDLSNEDFNELWPLIIGLFVAAFAVKIVISMFSQNASRN